jgi:thiopeptide-type bacteriocin biosynthesis protein
MKHNWMSVHLFYYGSIGTVLTECIVPLIEKLRTAQLIQRYFFIRYWLEGYHIRLRLLPAEGITHERIQQEIEPEIKAYLQRRPALFVPADAKTYQDIARKLYIAEYGEGWLRKHYGEEGAIPLRPNNSFAYIPYVPEYNRYGGQEGVALAEWHFEQSSDIVLQLLENVNAQERTILLGIGTQLTLAYCYAFFEQERDIISFLEGYLEFWQKGYNTFEDWEPLQKRYQRGALSLQKRITDLKKHFFNPSGDAGTEIERRWFPHLLELRERLTTLVERRALQFRRSEQEDFFVPDSPDVAYRLLLRSYIHMTSNRLGISIQEEVYLAYLLRCALQDLVSAQGVVQL